MFESSIYFISEISSMTKTSFYLRFPDKNDAWVMSLNAREMNRAFVILFCGPAVIKLTQ